MGAPQQGHQQIIRGRRFEGCGTLDRPVFGQPPIGVVRDLDPSRLFVFGNRTGQDPVADMVGQRDNPVEVGGAESSKERHRQSTGEATDFNLNSGIGGDR